MPHLAFSLGRARQTTEVTNLVCACVCQATVTRNWITQQCVLYNNSSPAPPPNPIDRKYSMLESTVLLSVLKFDIAAFVADMDEDASFFIALSSNTIGAAFPVLLR